MQLILCSGDTHTNTKKKKRKKKHFGHSNLTTPQTSSFSSHRDIYHLQHKSMNSSTRAVRTGVHAPLFEPEERETSDTTHWCEWKGEKSV